MESSKKTIRNFTLYGVAFGLLFPIFSSIVETLNWDLPLTMTNIFQVQKETPLLWVIDSAPLVIGILARVIGFRQSRLEKSNLIAEERYQKELKLRTEIDMLNQNLELRIQERTKDVEQRSRYLQAAAEVARKSTSILNHQELLETIVNEISRQFDFYHVGIFLLDDRNEWAVLRSASSIGGKQMIERGHRLAVGKQGMVGFVTSIGEARITQDVELDRIHSVTKELPDTRSEMALPMTARNKIIGALDIQDSKPNAFTQDDVAVLQTMTDQISLALENIRLFEQTQADLEEIQRAYGEFSEQAWGETFQKDLLQSYRYFGGSVSPLPKDDPSKNEDGTFSVPVSVRGYTIGTIEITKEDSSRDWNSDEIRLLEALSEQIGIALDSARLFNETQLRATYDD
jgi:GAF domain-containing protein